MTHDEIGREPIGILKKSSTHRTIYLAVAMLAGLPVRTAVADDAPTLAPTRLEFDATSAPKNCNDDVTFGQLLTKWAPALVVTPDADRRLVVRIRRAPAGEKLVDVTLTDAAGTTVAEHRKRFAATAECHKVLYDTAFKAAKLLGAHEEPPPQEPCPAAPPPPEPSPPSPPVEPAPCPACFAVPLPPLRRRNDTPLQWLPPPSPMRRTFVAGGIFIGMGNGPVPFVGPLVSLGFAPSARVPELRLEIDGAWAPYASLQSSELRGDMIPLFGSLCYAPSALRLCSGLVTTFFLVDRSRVAPENDTAHLTVAASLRLGAEFEIAEPFSIRLDAFALVPLWGQMFGNEMRTLDDENSFAAGGVVMGVWSFE